MNANRRENSRPIHTSLNVIVGIAVAINTFGVDSIVPANSSVSNPPSVTETAAGDMAEPVAPAESEFVSGDWLGTRTALSRRGLDIQLSYTGEVLGNVHGGLKTGAIYEGLFRPQIEFDLAKFSGRNLGTFRASALLPHGRSLTEHYLGDLFTLSNVDAPHDPRLYELWYEQSFWSDRLSLRLGQLAADEEFAITEYGCLFINGTCGWPAFLGMNTPSAAFPTAAPGARLSVNLSDQLMVQSGIFEVLPMQETRLATPSIRTVFGLI